MLKILKLFRPLCRNNDKRCQSQACSGGSTYNPETFDKIAYITRVWFTSLPERSNFISPCRMYYLQDEMVQHWDLVRISDAVMGILYNKETKHLVMVRQFRPALYFGIIMEKTNLLPSPCVDLNMFPPHIGITLEFCAGFIDKSLSLNETIQRTVLVESGYDIPIDNFEKVISFRSGIGTSCANFYMMYSEVTDEQKVSEGGGTENERIEVVDVSLSDAYKFIEHGTNYISPPGVLLGLYWFFNNKAPHT